MDWSDFWVACLQVLIGTFVVCVALTIVLSMVKAFKR